MPTMMNSSNRPLIEEDETEYTPEEAALLMRLRVFITMRWLAIVGVIIATLTASTIFHVSFSTLPVYVICAFMALYNLVLLRQTQRLKVERSSLVVRRAMTYGNIHIFLDLAALTVLLHFTGGIENPFIFFFVFHVIIASMVLRYVAVYMLVTAAMAMVSLLVGLEYAGVIPHINLAGFAAPELYRDGSYILAILVALASVLYASTYMATTISGELRKRQRQVTQLRKQLLEEKTRELELASREVVKLEDDKSRFLNLLTIAAHDLKAPLSGIQSFLWVSLDRFSEEFTDKQRDMMERISQRINDLLNLISDLLDIPHIETAQMIREIEVISLREVVKRSIDDLSNSAKEKGIKLKVELPRSLPKICGSSPRLQQVVTNLISNAINYTPEGMVTVRITDHKTNLQVEVMDTGIGIPPDDLPRIFDDFFRASNVEVKGTGLGLSIVKRIIEAHGGKIWVESPCPESDTGSKFTFTLPKSS